MRANSSSFDARLCEKDFKALADVYRVAMKRANLKPGTVLCGFAEDETATDPKVGWDHVTNSVVGMCGDECKMRCKKITDCRKRGCADSHACRSEFTIRMDGPYDEFQAKLEKGRVSTMARAIVINPLHEALPRLVCLWTGVCKTFASMTYVLPQWDWIETLFRQIMEPVIGRLVTNASDGDSTRRLAFMIRCYIYGDNEAWLPNIPSFVFTCHRDPSGRPVLSLDQCYVHNVKKILNNAASGRRVLQMGPTQTASLAMLAVFVESVPEHVHGAKDTDTCRKGFAAMDFPSVVRVISGKFRTALQEWVLEKGRVEFVGVQSLLHLAWTYLDIFMSRTCSLKLRIEAAGYVVTYLVVWQTWTDEFVAGANERMDTEVDRKKAKDEASSRRRR
jgi:hypothetical protein